MDDNILNLRVVGNKGYMLNETIESINESIAGETIRSILTTVLLSLLDDGTGELSGFALLLPGYVKNTYQLYQTNKEIEIELNNPNPDKEKLKILQDALLRDLKDILRLLLIASPVPVGDGVLAGSIELLNQKTITISYDMLTSYLQEKIPKFVILEKLLTYGGNALGFKIISSAVDNIGIINNYIETDGQTYIQEDLFEQLREDDARKIRWQVLSGIN